MSMKYLALGALLATIFFWGFFAVVARFAVSSASPMVLLFMRFFVGAICFLPFILRDKPWRKRKFRELLTISMFSTVNVVLFIWGIQYTSASASQVIYAALPILILIYNFLILKEKHPWIKVAGILVGFMGIAYIVYLSAIEKGTTISGSLKGNITIIFAMVGWLTYLLRSKKIAKDFTPIEISSTSIFVSLAVAVLLLGVEIATGYAHVSGGITMILIGLYMGIFASFLAYMCLQFAIAHLKSLTVSLTSYIQPIATTLFATLLIGEKLTPHFAFGSVLVLAGVFFTSSLEAYHHQQKKARINVP